MAKAREQLMAFLFPADVGSWLTFLRMGLGLQVILYTWSLRDDWDYFFSASRSMLSNRGLTEAILSSETSWTPRIGWLVTLGGWFNLRQDAVLSLVWLLLLLVGCCLLVGFFCRSAAILAWFLYLCSVKSGELLAYGVDTFTTIGLFYLMIAPLPDRFALDSILWKGGSRDPERLGFHRRVLQLHLCAIYFFGGFSKCLGTDWWNGISVWRALIRPPFNLIAPEILVRLTPLLAIAGILVCLLEAGYPVFIWVTRTRLYWLGGIVAIHVMIGLTMGLYLFALVMIVLNLAAFLPAPGMQTKSVSSERIASDNRS
jgi:hypothetical protein